MAVPTISGVPGQYRLFFYSFDCGERPHVHVQRESRICKFWLRPVRLAQGGRFGMRDLFAIETLILQHLELIEAAWNEHCGS